MIGLHQILLINAAEVMLCSPHLPPTLSYLAWPGLLVGQPRQLSARFAFVLPPSVLDPPPAGSLHEADHA